MCKLTMSRQAAHLVPECRGSHAVAYTWLCTAACSHIFHDKCLEAGHRMDAALLVG